MQSQRLAEGLGFALGFGLIIYGFNLISIGIPGARTFTSQFLAGNLLLGGSVLVFISLYYLLRPITATAEPSPSQAPVELPEIGAEMIVEEATPPKPGFYKTIEYIGYFFTIIGLISAADLVLQVFIRSIYNELRWWIEVLLVTFGVLSYTIFGSVGKLGMQEESKLSGPTVSPLEPTPRMTPSAAVSPSGSAPSDVTTPFMLTFEGFSQNSEGEYERRVSGDSFDMARVDPELVTVWREDRREMRSVYLAGPYEFTKKFLEDSLSTGEELQVGVLTVPIDSIRRLLGLMEKLRETSAAASV